jgi:four helix bundle protein
LKIWGLEIWDFIEDLGFGDLGFGEPAGFVMSRGGMSRAPCHQVTPDELKTRLIDFAAETVKFCSLLRQRPGAIDIANQLSSSVTSVAANYRSACRARSRKEFISKLAVATEEADETVGWLELLVKSRLASGTEVEALAKEADEVLRILGASRRTAGRNL